MAYLTKKRPAELNTSSVADITFLLLTFFLMTTVINNEKGLTMTLPEWRDISVEHPVNERNLFKIQINSMDELLIRGERTTSLDGLRASIKEFILNNDSEPHLSENLKAAIVSIKADRGTSHAAFMEVLDEAQAAYYEIYSERVGLSPDAYRALQATIPSDRLIIDQAKEGIPMNISIAEPTELSPR